MIDILSTGANIILSLGFIVVMIVAFALAVRAGRNKRLRNETGERWTQAEIDDSKKQAEKWSKFFNDRNKTGT